MQIAGNAIAVPFPQCCMRGHFAHHLFISEVLRRQSKADFHISVARFCCIQTFTNVTFGNVYLLAAGSPWRSYYKCH